MLFGTTYLIIVGSGNPIQILITIGTLVLFACLGLVGMNSAYCRFYNIQVPFMKIKLEERNGNIQNSESHVRDLSGSDVTIVADVTPHEEIKLLEQGESNVKNR